MKTIIGLAGVKESGKTTSANIILKNFGGIESALADKLKDTCAEVFDLKREIFDDQRYKEVPFGLFGIKRELSLSHIIDVLKEFDIELTRNLSYRYVDSGIVNMELKSARHIAQIVGTEVLRMAGVSYIHCKNVKLGDGLTVISDLRFPDEYEYFKNLHNEGEIVFIPLHIKRDGPEEVAKKSNHLSETSLFLFSDKCVKINNNESLEETEDQILRILNPFLRK